MLQADFRRVFSQNTHFFHEILIFFRNYHVIKRIWSEFSFHTVSMKLVVCFICPRQRHGDIKHTTRFITKIHFRSYIYIIVMKAGMSLTVLLVNRYYGICSPSGIEINYCLWKGHFKIRYILYPTSLFIYYKNANCNSVIHNSQLK